MRTCVCGLPHKLYTAFKKKTWQLGRTLRGKIRRKKSLKISCYACTAYMLLVYRNTKGDPNEHFNIFD